MNETIRADLFRYLQYKGTKGFIKGMLIPGFRYTYIIRKLSTYNKYSIFWFIFTFLEKHYSFKYGFQIPSMTKIGKGLFIGHYGTVVINGRAIIGENCNFSHNITIGQANRGSREGNPTIGDKVWIGTGSVIVGKITIGSNVLIAPNSYVNIDVPSNSIVVGNPCKIIRNENAIEKYIENIYTD